MKQSRYGRATGGRELHPPPRAGAVQLPYALRPYPEQFRSVARVAGAPAGDGRAGARVCRAVWRGRVGVLRGAVARYGQVPPEVSGVPAGVRAGQPCAATPARPLRGSLCRAPLPAARLPDYGTPRRDARQIRPKGAPAASRRSAPSRAARAESNPRARACAGAVPPVAAAQRPVAAEMLVRMLFSCLVDADFLDTEAHFNQQRAAQRPQGYNLHALWHSSSRTRTPCSPVRRQRL